MGSIFVTSITFPTYTQKVWETRGIASVFSTREQCRFCPPPPNRNINDNETKQMCNRESNVTTFILLAYKIKEVINH